MGGTHAAPRNAGVPPSARCTHYEDCALLPFEEAKRLGKACIYDLPIGYFEAWEKIAPQLSATIRGLDDASAFVSFRQPGTEARGIGLADLVLAPSAFVADSARETFPDKSVALAPFGVDLAAWPFHERRAPAGVMTFFVRRAVFGAQG